MSDLPSFSVTVVGALVCAAVGYLILPRLEDITL